MNKENYKKAMDKIQASEELKNKTLEKLEAQNNKTYKSLMYLTGCVAILVLMVVVGVVYTRNPKEVLKENKHSSKVVVTNDDLPRIKSISQLKSIIKNNASLDMMNKETTTAIAEDSAGLSQNDTASREGQNYSNTNVQVENVDEADIVKTDGDYIYYTSNNKVYIVNKDLGLESKIEISVEEDETIYIRELFINKDKLVIFGNLYEHYARNEINSRIYDYAFTGKSMAVSIIYNISDKSKPREIRRIGLDGSYQTSRMIGDNVYFISEKTNYYYKGTDDEILPIYLDTIKSSKINYIPCNEIAYFENDNNADYLMVSGFNLNDVNQTYRETFLGASNIVYASDENLYITAIDYNSKIDEQRTNIYKFKLDDAKISLVAQGSVRGYLNNQFSMDEYDGNLRVAFTETETIKEEHTEIQGDIAKTTIGEYQTKNGIEILDKDLKQIGYIDNLAVGERIYSVRFMGKIGYVVTFEQVDPLFVIDLSNPRKPEVKGELKIPGYSSYLHPYDEKHIIGIGYNTEPNGYGGVRNNGIKMSMFDVSDLENPVEMYNVTIGSEYSNMSLGSNHKVLFYDKSRDLIGFPVSMLSGKSYDTNGFVIYKINLESGFEEYAKIETELDWNELIQRSIYIDDVLYTLSNSIITSYDINSLEKIKELKLEK